MKKFQTQRNACTCACMHSLLKSVRQTRQINFFKNTDCDLVQTKDTVMQYGTVTHAPDCHKSHNIHCKSSKHLPDRFLYFGNPMCQFDIRCVKNEQQTQWRTEKLSLSIHASEQHSDSNAKIRKHMHWGFSNEPVQRRFESRYAHRKVISTSKAVARLHNIILLLWFSFLW